MSTTNSPRAATAAPGGPGAEPVKRSVRRRAALISTAVAVPVVVLLAFAFSATKHDAPSSTASSVLTVPAPPLNPGSDALCARIIAKLPVTLAGLPPRRVTTAPAAGGSQSIVAWGAPAVVLRCGVPRPGGLAPASAAYVQQIADTGTPAVQWLPTTAKGSTVFTSIDRAVYVEVTVPAKYSGADVMATLSGVVARVAPAVCQAQATNGTLVPTSQLCTHRA